jgi:hypothetical protein
MNEVLIGAIAALSFCAGLFFFRFWRASGDRFFLLFALSFWIEAVNRVVLYEAVGMNEDAPLYYIVRCIAYTLILVAVIDKNRAPRRRR